MEEKIDKLTELLEYVIELLDCGVKPRTEVTTIDGQTMTIQEYEDLVKKEELDQRLKRIRSDGNN